ncbi:MAG: hypothetical protein QW343_03745, partial [Candidatus Norongarragalinales archaeon]
VDALRARGESVGLVRLRCFRPFPAKALAQVFSKVERVIVVEKAVCLGGEGILASELKAALFDAGLAPKILGVVEGLGGREVRVRDVVALYEKNKK